MRALLGAVTPTLRAVSVELENNTLIWQGIFAEEARDEEMEFISLAGAELLADFTDVNYQEIIIKFPVHEKMNHLKHIIYLRHE